MGAVTLPRYKEIEAFLLDRILSGAYPVHHQIPTEMQLARDFSVSRMTVNKAIAHLVQRGFLVRQAGLGTFVTDRKAESPLHAVMNIAEEVRDRGHTHSSTVLRCEAVLADEAVALWLGVRLGTRVFHSLLIHREDGVPIQVEDRYVNPRWVPQYLENDFSRRTPNAVLEASCPISDVEHVVEAVQADAQHAGWLDVGENDACLLVVRRTWSGDHLISYARLLHPGGRYRLRSRTRLR